MAPASRSTRRPETVCYVLAQVHAGSPSQEVRRGAADFCCGHAKIRSIAVPTTVSAGEQERESIVTDNLYPSLLALARLQTSADGAGITGWTQLAHEYRTEAVPLRDPLLSYTLGMMFLRALRSLRWGHLDCSLRVQASNFRNFRAGEACLNALCMCACVPVRLCLYAAYVRVWHALVTCSCARAHHKCLTTLYSNIECNVQTRPRKRCRLPSDIHRPPSDLRGSLRLTTPAPALVAHP